MSYRRRHEVLRGVVVMLATAVIATAGALAIAAAWPSSAGPSGPSQQTCQFLRWEYKSLWPDGGGPPLPAGC